MWYPEMLFFVPLEITSSFYFVTAYNQDHHRGLCKSLMWGDSSAASCGILKCFVNRLRGTEVQ
jgi:hypothetical protein